MLKPTPASLDLAQTMLPARFSGPLQWFRHGDGGNPVWRFFHHKEWYYVGASTGELFCAAAVVNLGYVGKAFVYVVDRKRKAFLWHREVLLPAGPWLQVSHGADGSANSFLRHPLFSVALSRDPDGNTTVMAKDGSQRLRMFLRNDARTRTLVAANQLPGGITNLTEKALGYEVSGELHGRHNHTLQGVGGVDYTNGFLPRHTTWRWAFLVGQHEKLGRLGINLVQGFNGACECAIFTEDAIHPVDEALIDYDPQHPMQPWTIESRCGRVQLELQPIAMHADATDLKVIRAKFSQPIGLYSGKLRIGDEAVEVSDLLGVAENQDVIW